MLAVNMDSFGICRHAESRNEQSKLGVYYLFAVSLSSHELVSIVTRD